MTETSPYETPDAELEVPPTEKSFQLREPVSRPIGSGWTWIAQGFNLFKLDPGAWILMLIVGLIIMIVVSLIPVVGQIAMMLTTYVWIGGIIIGCHEQDQGKPFTVQHLFAGFSNNTGKLILVSLLMSVVSIGIMFAMLGSLYFSMLTGDVEGSQEMMNDPMGFVYSMLLAFLIMVPIVMTVWFAPALIVINQVSIGQALKLSFKGCLKNILPLLLYFIIAFVLYLVSVIPLFLGLLVFFPTMYASMYTSYKDIFIEE